MELDFDKEINALLRQAARSGEFVSITEQNHLDADEISAFAENALPEKTRSFYIKHFAECDRCRTILSNTILLKTEAEIETASSAVAAPVSEIIAEKIPWYRKMFLMPNLAYTMGGLVLVFGGMLSFLVLQNVNKSGVSDVSQIQPNEAKRSNGPNASDDGISYSANTASNTNAAASNSSISMANSSSNSTASASNSATSNTQTFPPDKSLIQPGNVTGEPQKQDAAKPTDDLALARKSESRDAKEEELSDKNKAAETARNDEVARATTNPVTVPPPAPPPPPPPSITMQQKDDLPLNGRRTESFPKTAPSEKKRTRAGSGATGNSRQIGGKTFNRVGGVWIDSAYDRSIGGNLMLPPTRTIRRGSSEYQKLDKQVRIIAESLDGAVIVLWGNGAYRIQ